MLYLANASRLSSDAETRVQYTLVIRRVTVALQSARRTMCAKVRAGPSASRDVYTVVSVDVARRLVTSNFACSFTFPQLHYLGLAWLEDRV